MFGFNKAAHEEESKAVSEHESPENAGSEAGVYEQGEEASLRGSGVQGKGDSDVVQSSRFFKQAPTQILKPSIISEGFELVGDIHSSGGLHVEGMVTGKIYVDNMTIGAKGTVKGTVKCQSLNIKGVFDGEVVCDMLNLSGHAVVNGNVQYRKLAMSSGTVLTGKVRCAE